jgi:prevent-host-death family protein
MVMKTVGIADLKAHLSEHLRHVREGEVLTIVDRQTPVARLSPAQGSRLALTIRQPLRRLHTTRLPAPLRRKVDSLAALLEERQKR